jgi:tetratricopeptide (TPR) repeat protein
MAMDQGRFQKAMALRDSGREEEAIHELRAMAQEALEPNEKAMFTYGEAVCLLRLGRFEEARKCNRQAVAISPRDEIRSRVDFNEVFLCWEERKFQECLRMLNNMLRDYSDLLCTPDFRDLYEQIQRKRATLLTEFNRPREARPLLEEALSFELDAEDKATILYYLGVALYNLGDKDEAKTRLLAALQGRLYYDLRSVLPRSHILRRGCLRKSASGV